MASPQPVVQLLPPGPDRPELHFDQHAHQKLQFGRMVTAETRLTHADTNNMHGFVRKTDRGKRVPGFALNDKDLKLVLATYAYNYAISFNGRRGPKWRPCPPDLLKDQAKLIHIVRKHTEFNSGPRGGPNETERDMHARHLMTSEAAGSRLHLVSAIAWAAWRGGMTSTQIATDLWSRGIPVAPTNVRAILCRLMDTARRLGLDCPKKDMKKYVKYPGRGAHLLKLPQGEALIELLRKFSPDYIAQLFGVSPFAVYRALIRAGVIVRRVKRSPSPPKKIRFVRVGDRLIGQVFTRIYKKRPAAQKTPTAKSRRWRKKGNNYERELARAKELRRLRAKPRVQYWTVERVQEIKTLLETMTWDMVATKLGRPRGTLLAGYRRSTAAKFVRAANTRVDCRLRKIRLPLQH